VPSTGSSKAVHAVRARPPPRRSAKDGEGTRTMGASDPANGASLRGVEVPPGTVGVSSVAGGRTGAGRGASTRRSRDAPRGGCGGSGAGVRRGSGGTTKSSSTSRGGGRTGRGGAPQTQKSAAACSATDAATAASSRRRVRRASRTERSSQSTFDLSTARIPCASSQPIRAHSGVASSPRRTASPSRRLGDRASPAGRASARSQHRRCTTARTAWCGRAR
jgi:hypothetical protein